MATTSSPGPRGGAAVRATTLPRMILASRRHPGVALRVPSGDAWSDTTFAALGDAVTEVAAGLIDLGVRPGDRVAILGETRPEWTIADGGALCAGATVVPVYHTSSPEECRYVLAHAGVRVLICDDATQLAKIEAVRGELPALEHVITMVPAEGVPSLADLRARAGEEAEAAVERAVENIQPDDPATIVYTSGTTGPPKGCVLTHANCLATVAMYRTCVELDASAVIFMFLPLAHALARVVEFVALDVGATLAFWQRDPKRLLDDLAGARPTHFPSVPRLFEKIHGRAMATAEESSTLRRRIFTWGLATGTAVRRAQRDGGSPSPLLRAQHAVADRLVLSRVRALFGGELQLGLTGAAPIAREVLEFFDACGILVLEGYGLTETCAAATLNPPRGVRLGSVGPALDGAAVRVADDGEVLVQGPNVFAGYYEDPAATAEIVAGDWLRTGDLGELDEDGFLTITGRKKDLIITSSGKNIAPANLETALRESRWISEAVVFGDNKPYLVAVLTLDKDELGALAQRAGVPEDRAAMATDPRVQAVIQSDVDEVNARFARIEQIKRFAILEQDLTQGDGELTPTLKVKRAAVAEHYGEQIAALYG
ncbi:MAG TPA: long-chain fatty acid--CoA ligase [Solirubrobacteraceae bacterium]|nr:long-chain fatty acid--CoA ligase [Solirubrobacteraceae bacterium]